MESVKTKLDNELISVSDQIVSLDIYIQDLQTLCSQCTGPHIWVENVIEQNPELLNDGEKNYIESLFQFEKEKAGILAAKENEIEVLREKRAALIKLLGFIDA